MEDLAKTDTCDGFLRGWNVHRQTHIIPSTLRQTIFAEAGPTKANAAADFKSANGFNDFKSALLQQPGIISVSGSYESPSFVKWGGKDGAS